MVFAFFICHCGPEYQEFKSKKEFANEYLAKNSGFVISNELPFPFKYFRKNVCETCNYPYLATAPNYTRKNLIKFGLRMETDQISKFYKEYIDRLLTGKVKTSQIVKMEVKRYSFSVEITKILYNFWRDKLKPEEPDYNFEDFLAQMDSMEHY